MKKKFGADYEQPLRAVFQYFHVQKIDLFFFENNVAFALKSCIEKSHFYRLLRNLKFQGKYMETNICSLFCGFSPVSIRLN